jgi:hypothetical protein
VSTEGRTKKVVSIHFSFLPYGHELEKRSPDYAEQVNPGLRSSARLARFLKHLLLYNSA